MKRRVKKTKKRRLSYGKIAYTKLSNRYQKRLRDYRELEALYNSASTRISELLFYRALPIPLFTDDEAWEALQIKRDIDAGKIKVVPV